MYHPETMYDLVKLRMAEDLRMAEHERLVRRAGEAQPNGAIDAVKFRDRLTRLFGAVWPASHHGASPSAA